MKRILAVLLALFLSIGLAACSLFGTDGTAVNSTVESVEPIAAEDIVATDATADFSITTEDGSYLRDGSAYTITSAGTYVLTGYLNGQVLIHAGEDDEVVLELAGVTIENASDSPVKVLTAGKLEVSAQKDTENTIRDMRSEKTADVEGAGEGAIYANCDLKIKGKGVLVIEASYNNGIHTTDDLEIQNLSLKVTAVNNALKGNDSVTVNSGTVLLISTKGDGVKTENTDVNKKGITRGDIRILGGKVSIYAAGDGIQAAHDFELSKGEGDAPVLTVYTGSYSPYTASSAATTSYKGIKVQNELRIADGTVALETYDDGLHADYGTSFDVGTKGLGNIVISGGSVIISVYSPANKTAGGRTGRGGFGFQQTVIGADGIHADSELTISGGTVVIDSAYEGLEANIIRVTGGVTTVSANDDGVNASSGKSTPAVIVSGGILDVTVSPNGDTDGIDSNGTYTQTGGIVITRGPSNQNMAAIDADSSVTISGGTLIVLGYGSVRTGGSVKTYSMSLHAAGTHTITAGNTTYTFTNANAYGRTTVYSDVTVSAGK